MCVRGVVAGELSVGDVVLFLSLMTQLMAPLTYFSSYYRQASFGVGSCCSTSGRSACCTGLLQHRGLPPRLVCHGVPLLHGAVSAFISCSQWAAVPGLHPQIQKGLIDMEQMFELLDTAPAVDDMPGAGQLVVAQGDVAFDRVSFGCAAVRGARGGRRLRDIQSSAAPVLPPVNPHHWAFHAHPPIEPACPSTATRLTLHPCCTTLALPSPAGARWRWWGPQVRPELEGSLMAPQLGLHGALHHPRHLAKCWLLHSLPLLAGSGKSTILRLLLRWVHPSGLRVSGLCDKTLLSTLCTAMPLPTCRRI